MRTVATNESDGTVFRVVRCALRVAARHRRTDSIDYAVVMSGSMEMELDNETVRLNAGDVVVPAGHSQLSQQQPPGDRRHRRLERGGQ
jgi:mannose-6-phosphate isomerase-like protein (cupin superfamily)